MKSNLILSLNNAKDFLKNKNKDGYSVYDHICDLINFIVVEKPEKCYENFELISNHIKESKKSNTKILSEKEAEDNNLDNYILNEYTKKKREWLEKIKLLFIKKSEIEPINLPFMRDFYEQMKLINWAGYQIKKSLIFYLNNSIKKKLEQYKDELKSLKFWGILKGIKNDYYILEGELKNKKDFFFNKKKKKKSEKDSDNSDDETLSSSKSSSSLDDNKDYPQKMKQKKKKKKTEKQKKKNKFTYKKEDYEYFNKKVNKNVYWVSINGKDEWVLLKFTMPKYIKIANKIDKMLTGDLNHSITSFPDISIKEKHYLRAIISIISSNTHISPKNYFILKQKSKDKENTENKKSNDEEEDDERNENEEDEEEDDDEEKEQDEENLKGNENDDIIENKKFQFETNYLLNIDNWVYYKYNFLPNGHINYPKNMKFKNNKKVQNMIKKNPPLKLLRNINNEEQENNYSWKIKHLNQGGYYGINNSHYDVIIIYNLLYYGAFTIYFNKQYFNFYIGNGIKLRHTFLHTYAPRKIQSDKSELSEVDQIN